MTVLKYRDPVSGQYVSLSSAGPAGPQGPVGPRGPAGDPKPVEVSIGSAQPVADEVLWVSTAGTVRYDDAGTYKVPAQLRGNRLTGVGTPSAATDAATVGYAKQNLVTADTGWKYPTFYNNWGNYGHVYARAAYRRLGNGMVVVQGLISSGTMGAPAFYLDPGYRPQNQLNYSSYGGNGIVLVEYHPDGRVLPQAYSSTGSNGFVSVNYMFYPA